MHDERGNPARAVDGAPSIAFEVEHNKEIAGEEGSQNGLAFASMTDRFRMQRQEGAKVLSSETKLCSRFPMRLSVNGVPMLPFVKNVIGRRRWAEADCHAMTPLPSFRGRTTRRTLPHIGWCSPPGRDWGIR